MSRFSGCRKHVGTCAQDISIQLIMSTAKQRSKSVCHPLFARDCSRDEEILTLHTFKHINNLTIQKSCAHCHTLPQRCLPWHGHEDQAANQKLICTIGSSSPSTPDLLQSQKHNQLRIPSPWGNSGSNWQLWTMDYFLIFWLSVVGLIHVLPVLDLSAEKWIWHNPWIIKCFLNWTTNLTHSSFSAILYLDCFQIG